MSRLRKAIPNAIPQGPSRKARQHSINLTSPRPRARVVSDRSVSLPPNIPGWDAGRFLRKLLFWKFDDRSSALARLQDSGTDNVLLNKDRLILRKIFRFFLSRRRRAAAIRNRFGGAAQLLTSRVTVPPPANAKADCEPPPKEGKDHIDLRSFGVRSLGWNF